MLRIQAAHKERPPNRGFYSCCAFNLSKKCTKNLFSPRKGAFSLEVDGRCTGGGREVHGRRAKMAKDLRQFWELEKSAAQLTACNHRF